MAAAIRNPPTDGFVVEGTIPNNLGDNLEHELEIEAVERTGEATALHFTVTNQGAEIGRVNDRGAPPILFDPVGGELYWPLIDGEPTDASPDRYGSHSDEDVPYFEGVHNELRLYYPALPEDVDTVTFFGFGVGAMPGIPVTDVDEHQPDWRSSFLGGGHPCARATTGTASGRCRPAPCPARGFHVANRSRISCSVGRDRRGAIGSDCG